MQSPKIYLTTRSVQTKVGRVLETESGLFLVLSVEVGAEVMPWFWKALAEGYYDLTEYEPVLRYQYGLPPLAEWSDLVRFSIAYQLAFGHALNDYDRFRPYLVV